MYIITIRDNTRIVFFQHIVSMSRVSGQAFLLASIYSFISPIRHRKHVVHGDFQRISVGPSTSLSGFCFVHCVYFPFLFFFRVRNFLPLSPRKVSCDRIRLCSQCLMLTEFVQVFARAVCFCCCGRVFSSMCMHVAHRTSAFQLI